MSSSHTPTSWPAPPLAARCPHQQWTAWSSPPGWCPALFVQPQSYQPAKSGSTRPRPLHNVWLHWCSQWHCRWRVEHPWRTLAWLEGEERPRTTILLLFTGTCCKKGAFNLSHKPFERIFKLRNTLSTNRWQWEHTALAEWRTSHVHLNLHDVSQYHMLVPILSELIASPAPNKLKRLVHDRD